MKAPFASRAPLKAVLHKGPLDWRVILDWLREDGIISQDDSDRTAKRFGAGDSSQHSLVRLGGARLVRLSDGKILDIENLTEWVAQRSGLPYLRIDPLKVDVGRVAEVMSITYAERRRALPIQVGAREVVVATCEPFDVEWVPEIEAHTQKNAAFGGGKPGRVRALHD